MRSGNPEIIDVDTQNGWTTIVWDNGWIDWLLVCIDLLQQSAQFICLSQA